MYYPIGWPRKLSCNLNFNSPVPCSEPQGVDGITKPLDALKLNGDASKLTHNESNGHIPQSPEILPRPSKGLCTEKEVRILQILANGDRSLLLVLTNNSLHLWYPKVSLIYPAMKPISYHI